MRADFRSNRTARTHGHAENDKISPRHRFSSSRENLVANAKLQGRGAGFFTAGVAYNFARELAAPPVALSMGLPIFMMYSFVSVITEWSHPRYRRGTGATLIGFGSPPTSMGGILASRCVVTGRSPLCGCPRAGHTPPGRCRCGCGHTAPHRPP